MFEAGVFHNGSFDLPTLTEHRNSKVYASSLSDGHSAAQRSVLSQVRMGILADRLGLDYFWMSEHHFQPEGIEFSPNPVLVQTAIAAQTSRIRLGQAANIINWHHPVRLAEQIAMLDVISGGRTEVGLGRGYQPRESEVLGRPYGSTIQDQERNRSAYAEAYDIMIKCWTEDSFQHRGEFFSLPPSYTKWNHPQTISYFSQDGGVGRDLDQVLNMGADDPNFAGPPVFGSTTTVNEISVYPHPVQKPYPQLWFPVTSERTIRLAASKGMNAYIFADAKSRLKANVDIYTDEAEKCGYPDRLNRGAFKYGWDSTLKRGMSIGRWIHIVDKGIGDMQRAQTGMEASLDFYGPFGFVNLFKDLDEKPVHPSTRVPIELAREKEVAIHGSKEYVIDAIMRLKEYMGFSDMNFMAFLDLPGFSTEEKEEQLACWAEDIVPVLRRECGGGVDLPSSDVVLDVQGAPSLASVG